MQWSKKKKIVINPSTPAPVWTSDSPFSYLFLMPLLFLPLRKFNENVSIFRSHGSGKFHAFIRKRPENKTANIVMPLYKCLMQSQLQHYGQF